MLLRFEFVVPYGNCVHTQNPCDKVEMAVVQLARTIFAIARTLMSLLRR